MDFLSNLLPESNIADLNFKDKKNQDKSRMIEKRFMTSVAKPTVVKK